MQPLRVIVAESGHTSEIRRRVETLARGLGFSETDRGKAALVVTEVATNLLKHVAHGGEVLVRVLEAGNVRGIEIVALDRGPGMRSIGQALSDGYSTAGSSGTGLGAIRRQASFFDLYSQPGGGTALLAEVWPGGSRPPRDAAGMDVGAVRVPHPNEVACGDAWAVESHERRWLGLVVDGLGHGVLASEAAEKAVETFRKNLRRSPEGLIGAIDAALRSTRGGVGAVAEINAARDKITYAGVGNIAAVLSTSEGSRSMVSHNGTLGQAVRKIQAFEYPWSPDTTLVMHSDGVNTRWNLKEHPGLERKPSALIAGVLYRDCSRNRDDATVLVAKAAGS